MIPKFNEHGYLPAGIHTATIAEVEARFGRDPEIRRAEMQSVHWLIDLSRRAGAKRIILNGSFVTDRYEPNDVVCALLIDEEILKNPVAQAEIEADLPILIEIVDAADKVQSLLPFLDEVVKEGLITIEAVKVLRYRHDPAKARG